MYTVLLIDDEPNVLETLSESIHWQQLGVSTVLTATGSLPALKIMQQQDVHLLITDINMPHMDGLVLLEKVTLQYPDTHCILLTAYNEFSYAQKAIRLGVENYLLKPFETEEMEETIEKALDNIYTNQKLSKKLFETNILSRWVNGDISSAELGERANLISLNLYLPQYCVICIAKKQPTLSLSTYCKICQEKLSSVYEVHYFKDECKRYIFIIGGNYISLTELLQSFTAEASRSYISHLIALSAGNVIDDIRDIRESHQLAISLINGAILSDPKLMLLTPEDSLEQNGEKWMQKLDHVFHLQEEEKRQDELLLLGQAFYDLSKSYSIKEIISLLTQSLSALFSREFSEQPEALEHLHRRIQLCTTLADEGFTVTSIIELLEYSYLLFNYHFNQLSPIIKAAIHYIHTCYGESISIKEFCVKNKMNTAYFGYLFKKETGTFFNNYLTQHRVCISIQMLLDTDMQINDIALATGFSSPNYYIRCFKKQTGLSPIKYRSLYS